MATTGIVQRFGTKDSLSTDNGGLDRPRQGELVFATDTGEFGYLDETSDLVWINFNNYFNKEEFVDTSNGGANIGAPVKLDALGLIADDMLPIHAFTSIGGFTPSGGTLATEYPDVVGQSYAFGSFWDIEGVSNIEGYTYITGELATQTVLNGDSILWTASGWTISRGVVNGELYYELDGSSALTDNFNGGNFQLKAIADGTDLTDGVTVQQLDAVELKTDTNTTDIGNHIIDIINPHAVTATQVGLGSVDDTSDADKPISTLTQTALDLKADTSGNPLNLFEVLDGTTGNEAINFQQLTTELALKSDTTHLHTGVYEPIDATILRDVNIGVDVEAYNVNIQTHIATVAGNPHAVTQAEVGLGNVDNTADIDKIVSIPTQTALDLKEDDLGNPLTDGYILSSTIAGVRTWIADANVTNLSYTPSPTDGTVVSSTGTDAVITLVDGTNAGLIIPADKVKVDFITVTGIVDLDTIDSDVLTLQSDVVTLQSDVIPKGGATRPIDPLLYTTFWDTLIAKLITCTDNTNGGNIWSDAQGVAV